MLGADTASLRERGRGTSLKLTEEQKNMIDVTFKAFASGDKNKITTDTLKQAFRDAGKEAESKDILNLIREVDENGDGSIDKGEWEGILSKKFRGEDDDSSFVHVFTMLDDNKDGYIPLVEFRNILMKEGRAPLSEQEVDELMMFADLQGDGLINYRDFLGWLNNPYKTRSEDTTPVNVGASSTPAQGPPVSQPPAGPPAGSGQSSGQPARPAQTSGPPQTSGQPSQKPPGQGAAVSNTAKAPGGAPQRPMMAGQTPGQAPGQPGGRPMQAGR